MDSSDRPAEGVFGNERKIGLTVVTDLREVGRSASYRSVAEEMRKVKGEMEHPEAKTYVTHGLRKNATIELYRAGCDDEMVRAVTGHSGAEMLKKYGGRVRQKALATRAQEARNNFENPHSEDNGRIQTLFREAKAWAESWAGNLTTDKGLRYGFGINATVNGIPLHILPKWIG